MLEEPLALEEPAVLEEEQRLSYGRQSLSREEDLHIVFVAHSLSQFGTGPLPSNAAE